jgi:hypothetical protein
MPVEAMGAVAPLPSTWTIHPSALTTATLTAARFAGFEPSAVLIATTAGSAGRGPVLLRSKAMALAIAFALAGADTSGAVPFPVGGREVPPVPGRAFCLGIADC